MNEHDPDWQQRADQTYQAIKDYYHRRNGKNWQAVTENPQLFNRAWRMMLGLPDSDKPPPADQRKGNDRNNNYWPG